MLAEKFSAVDIKRTWCVPIRSLRVAHCSIEDLCKFLIYGALSRQAPHRTEGDRLLRIQVTLSERPV